MTTMMAVVLALASFGAAEAVPLAGDYQVIQRGADNMGACFAPLGMDVPAGATVTFSVTRYGRPVVSGEKKADAALNKDQAGADIADLKPGGPYTISVTATNADGATFARAKYDGILVGEGGGRSRRPAVAQPGEHEDHADHEHGQSARPLGARGHAAGERAEQEPDAPASVLHVAQTQVDAEHGPDADEDVEGGDA